MLLESISIRNVSPAPTAANSSVTHHSSWKMARLTAKLIGTNYLQPNVSHAVSQWRPATDGSKLSLTIIIANASIVR